MQSQLNVATPVATSAYDLAVVGPYVIGRVIGQGSFAQVREAEHMRTHERVRTSARQTRMRKRGGADTNQALTRACVFAAVRRSRCAI